MCSYRSNFTLKEEKKILQYIVKHHAYNRLNCDNLWLEMEQAEIIDRPWLSIKQHFKKKMLANLQCPTYCLTEDEIKKILMGYKTAAEIISKEIKPKLLSSSSDED